MIRTYCFHGVNIKIRSEGLFPFECFEALFDIKPGRASKGQIEMIFDNSAPRPIRPTKGSRPVSLKRTREVKGFYNKERLVLSDNSSSLKIDYRSSKALFNLDDSILKYPKLFTHTLLPLALVELLKKSGFYYLHAACADIGGKGVLFTGTPGAGKTSACYSVLKSGAGWVSDDAVLVKRVSGKVYAYSFIKEFSIHCGQKALFPDLKRIKGKKKQDINKRGLLFSPFKKRSLPKLIVNIDRTPSNNSDLSEMRASNLIGIMIAENELLIADKENTEKMIDILTLLCRQAACMRLGGRDLILKPEAFSHRIVQFLN